MSIESKNQNSGDDRFKVFPSGGETEESKGKSKESRFKTPPIGETEKGSNETEKRAGKTYSEYVRDLILGKNLKKEELKPELGEGKPKLEESQPKEKKPSPMDALFGKYKPPQKNSKDVKESGIFGDRKSIKNRELELKMKNKGFSSEIYKKTRGQVQAKDMHHIFEKHFGKESSLKNKGYLRKTDVKNLMGNANNKRSLSHQIYQKNKELRSCRDVKIKAELKKSIKDTKRDLKVMREIFRDPKKL